MMCGLLFPTTGAIRIAGFDLERQGQEARQHISYVPDTPYLYEKLTGREVLAVHRRHVSDAATSMGCGASTR